MMAKRRTRNQQLGCDAIRNVTFAKRSHLLIGFILFFFLLIAPFKTLAETLEEEEDGDKIFFSTHLSTSLPPNNASSLSAENASYVYTSENASVPERDPKFKNNCSWDFSQLWPPNPPGPTLVLGYLMTQLGMVKERLGLKIVGMISYAVEYVNNNHILPENYTLQIMVC